MSTKTKKRISITMTQPYFEALDSLVDAGLYLGRGEVILEALRDFFERQGIESFCLEADKAPGPS